MDQIAIFNGSSEQGSEFRLGASEAKVQEKANELSNCNSVLLSRRNHENLIERIKFQVEFHFSDKNLEMDNYLLSQMHKDPEYWVPLEIVAKLDRIKELTTNEAYVLEAIERSRGVILSKSKDKVKKPGFKPPKPKHKNLRRTVFVCGLPPTVAIEEIKEMCKHYGDVKEVWLDTSEPKIGKMILTRDGNECLQFPDHELIKFIMEKHFMPRANKKKNRFPFFFAAEMVTKDARENGLAFPVNANNKTTSVPYCMNGTSDEHMHLFQYAAGSNCRSAFIIFSSQSQAKRCVHEQMGCKGVRVMHHYDFKKQQKRLSALKSKMSAQPSEKRAFSHCAGPRGKHNNNVSPMHLTRNQEAVCVSNPLGQNRHLFIPDTAKRDLHPPATAQQHHTNYISAPVPTLDSSPTKIPIPSLVPISVPASGAFSVLSSLSRTSMVPDQSHMNWAPGICTYLDYVTTQPLQASLSENGLNKEIFRVHETGKSLIATAPYQTNLKGFEWSRNPGFQDNTLLRKTTNPLLDFSIFQQHVLVQPSHFEVTAPNKIIALPADHQSYLYSSFAVVPFIVADQHHLHVVPSTTRSSLQIL